MANINNIGLLSRGSIRSILRNVRENGEPVECYITVCPFYDQSGGISGDYKSIQEVPLRYRQKFSAALESAKFLSEQIPLKVQLLLADQGILVSSQYDTDKAESDIDAIRKIYRDAVDFPVTTFSEIGLRLPRTSVIDREYTEKDSEGILEENGIDPNAFRNQLRIIAQSFGFSGAYFFLKNYLAESQFIGTNFQDALFINTEACAPLNTIYTLGGNRAVDTNCIMTVNISI